jgi:steroid 5-alpha reductase family enzyme
MAALPWFGFDSYNLLAVFLVIFGIQIVCFVFAALLKTDLLTDISYGLTFVLVVGWLLVGQATFGPAQLLAAGLIGLWGLRLGGYLFARILRMGRDARFDRIREHPLRFGLFWGVQALTIWIVLLPAMVLLSSPPAADWLAWGLVGAVVWALGLAIEAIADRQKTVFKQDPANRDRWIEMGLWRWARHPNYFGEMLCWWGVFLVAVPVLSGWSWAVALGPVFLMLLLRYGTGVPPLAKRYQRRFGDDPAYQAYLRRSWMFVPLPFGRR